MACIWYAVLWGILTTLFWGWNIYYITETVGLKNCSPKKQTVRFPFSSASALGVPLSLGVSSVTSMQIAFGEEKKNICLPCDPETQLWRTAESLGNIDMISFEITSQCSVGECLKVQGALLSSWKHDVFSVMYESEAGRCYTCLSTWCKSVSKQESPLKWIAVSREQTYPRAYQHLVSSAHHEVTWGAQKAREMRSKSGK